MLAIILLESLAMSRSGGIPDDLRDLACSTLSTAEIPVKSGHTTSLDSPLGVKSGTTLVLWGRWHLEYIAREGKELMFPIHDGVLEDLGRNRERSTADQC
jgi:hypothetical protein